ncbi:hypothetical protein [Paracoccus sp. (in: a-proteobacteria)]|uniref:hypothetical protein n=1 Tax=Paracoccus sp. TaxID=267 RepID=UPI002899DB48|nr:hypothetical protein [Paracoccus sp. (in: a-proteobacteria)]
MELGQELAQITAGLDQLYRAQNQGAGFLNAEGLIPVSVAPVLPATLESYDQAEAAIMAFRARLDHAQTPLRRDWLDEMSDSLLTLIATFRGDAISFGERLERQIRVTEKDIPDDIIAGYHGEIREALDALGYREGSLFEDFSRWEAKARVPKSDVLAVLGDYQKQARQRAAQMMFDLSEEWMVPVGRTDVPFSAYCDYLGREMLLNLDFPYTAFSLKHLATHEAFPGHLVHLRLREIAVDSGDMALDGAQVVTSSASSALFEGIADNGLQFLDWIETPEDHLGLAVQRLRSALRCRAAWRFHGEGQPLDAIIPEIAAQSLQSPETTARRLAFLHHDLRAPFIHAYWCGEMAVDRVWKKVHPEQRKDFWAYLYGNMHTAATLEKHWS